jgi:hypothetical protein
MSLNQAIRATAELQEKTLEQSRRYAVPRYPDSTL